MSLKADRWNNEPRNVRSEAHTMALWHSTGNKTHLFLSTGCADREKKYKKLPANLSVAVLYTKYICQVPLRNVQKHKPSFEQVVNNLNPTQKQEKQHQRKQPSIVVNKTRWIGQYIKRKIWCSNFYYDVTGSLRVASYFYQFKFNYYYLRHISLIL